MYFHLNSSERIVYEEEIVQPQQPPPQYQNLIIQHMDIAEPLSTLKRLLELRLQCSLADHQFYLQDSIEVGLSLSNLNIFSFNYFFFVCVSLFFLSFCLLLLNSLGFFFVGAGFES